LFKEIPHDVIYTDSSYKDLGDELGFKLAHLPYHRGKKYVLAFLLGKIAEWRGLYSSLWLKRNCSERFSYVYAFVYSTCCMKYAHWVSRKKNLPLAIHLADHNQDFEKSSALEILASAKKLICITEKMKQKYKSILGRREIHVLHNGAEKISHRLPRPWTGPFTQKTPFVLCFLGGLFSHLHADCIEDIFEAVVRLRNLDRAIEFHLYGQRQPYNFLENELNSDGCKHHGIVMPLNKKWDIMGKAHCFVIPSSFNANSNEHYQYSFPTKLPELIASRRPIISYGPIQTATNQFLTLNKIGTTISNRSVSNLVNHLENTIINYKEVLKVIESSDTPYYEKFSADSMRFKTQKILDSN